MFISCKDVWRNHQLAQINLIMPCKDVYDSRAYYINELLIFILYLKYFKEPVPIYKTCLEKLY